MSESYDHLISSSTAAGQNQSNTLQNTTVTVEPVTSSLTEQAIQPLPSYNTVPSRRSTRDHKPPSYLSEYVCHNAYSQQAKDQVLYCHNTITSICCNASLDCGLSPNTIITQHNHLEYYKEPVSYEEAASRPEWQEAMQKEFDALHDNNTWILTPLPVGKKTHKFQMGL